jgi:hypothetical protein
MRSIRMLTPKLAIFSLCLILASGSRIYAGERDSDGCQVAAEALTAASQLKPGMVRSDLEKNFVRDGGIAFPGSGTYVFKKCHYMKINVEFDAHDFDKTTQDLSKTDAIIRVSKLYLAYPVAD